MPNFNTLKTLTLLVNGWVNQWVGGGYFDVHHRVNSDMDYVRMMCRSWFMRAMYSVYTRGMLVYDNHIFSFMLLYVHGGEMAFCRVCAASELCTEKYRRGVGLGGAGGGGGGWGEEGVHNLVTSQWPGGHSSIWWPLSSERHVPRFFFFFGGGGLLWRASGVSLRQRLASWLHRSQVK